MATAITVSRVESDKVSIILDSEISITASFSHQITESEVRPMILQVPVAIPGTPRVVTISYATRISHAPHRSCREFHPHWHPELASV